MAGIRKVVKVELTDEEKETLRKASKILDELAEEDGADELFDIIDSCFDGLYFISQALENLVDNSK